MKHVGLQSGELLTCGKIVEDLHFLYPREVLIEFEHVKAHRTVKGRQEMAVFEK